MLPVRDEVKAVTYHRAPTKYEIKLGYGAIHYRTLSVEETRKPGTRILRGGQCEAFLRRR